MLLNEIKAVVSSANKREIRKFSLTIGIFLLVVAAFLFWKENASAQYLAITGGAVMVLGFTIAPVLKPIYIVWMSFAVIMGFIMTRVILTLLFALLFTPPALFMRLIGKNPLKEEADKQAESYWISREKKKYTRDSIEKQY